MSEVQSRLFDRRCDIVVDTLRLTNLRVAFKVKKTLNLSANTAEVRIYNLSPTHRDQLLEKEKVRVQLSAGFVDRMSVLFTGELRTAQPERDGTDVVVVLSSADGERQMQTSRVSSSFGAGTSVESVLGHLGNALGVGQGNSREMFAGRALNGVMRIFSSGTTVHGQTAPHLDRLSRAAGLEVSIQDGALQVLEIGQPLQGETIVLRPTTGLVGSPTIGTDHVMKARALLISDLRPGRLVQVEAEFVRGTFRLHQVEFQGDTFGGDWYASLEGRAA